MDGGKRMLIARVLPGYADGNNPANKVFAQSDENSFRAGTLSVGWTARSSGIIGNCSSCQGRFCAHLQRPMVGSRTGSNRRLSGRKRSGVDHSPARLRPQQEDVCRTRRYGRAWTNGGSDVVPCPLSFVNETFVVPSCT